MNVCPSVSSSHFSFVPFSAEIEDEEIDELACPEQSNDNEDLMARTEMLDLNETPKMSWLLQVVLKNLGVITSDSTASTKFIFN